jgi:hypothetical protein
VASFRFTCRTVTGKNRAPMMSSYSSRGPNHVAREILKPDVIAPGTNILAAWPGESPLTYAEEDPRRARFNIQSGTSMSCLRRRRCGSAEAQAPRLDAGHDPVGADDDRVDA